MPALLGALNGSIAKVDGRTLPRLVQHIHHLDEPADRTALLQGQPRGLSVPGRARPLAWEADKRSGIGLSRLGTSRATALGAYEFARLHPQPQ